MGAKGTAIDLGCGPGLLALGLAGRAAWTHVIGVDLSSQMLSRAKETVLSSQEGGLVSLGQCDARQLPLSDSSVDLAVSTLSLHHWREPVAVLDEMARVLAPGGAFLVFDLRRDLAAPFWLLLWCITRWAAPLALRSVNEPLSSCNAAYTPSEAMRVAALSQLTGWRVSAGPLWLSIEGTLDAQERT